MTKLTQFNMSDLADVNEAYSIVDRLGIDIHHPDAAVIRDVYYSVHMSKPTWRSRRRFDNALAALRKMSDGYNLGEK